MNRMVKYVVSINAIIQRKNVDAPEDKELIANTPQSLDGILRESQLDFTFRQAIEHVCNSAPTEEQPKATTVRNSLTATDAKKGERVDITLEANGGPVALDDPVKNFFEPDDVEIVPGRKVRVQRSYLRVNKTYTM